jgi:hypothetical protein
MVITDKVKKVLLKALAVLLILLGLGALGWWGKLQYDYLTYEDRREGVRIKYPRDWTMKDHPNPNVIVIFIAPQQNALQRFHESINLSTTDLSKNPLTIQQYAETAAKQVAAVFPDTVMEEKKFLKVSGHETVKFVFHATGTPEAMLVVYSLIYRNMAYTITYLGLADQYLLVKPKLDQVINSVKLFF